MEPLLLNKTNRLKLARAFRNHTRFDMGIDCAVEGQMGHAFADDVAEPTVFLIELGGFFAYLAGDARSTAGRELVAALNGSKLFIPANAGVPAEDDWAVLLQEVHGDRLVAVDRYRFSSEKVMVAHLDGQLRESPYRDSIRRIDLGLATLFVNHPKGWVDLGAYESAEDFVDRSIGYCLLDGDELLGVAYGSLVCSRGIEVSIFVHPEHRQRGLATALAASLLRYCWEHHMDANWDAANPASCKLAMKLGYVPRGSYVAQFLRG
jgi:GNAT superfamily N-acetyltransferase